MMTYLKMTDKEGGFTLVELLIYIAIFGVTLAALCNVFIINTRSYTSQENKMEVAQDVRSAMNMMITEIRMAGCDPHEIGNVGLLDDADDNLDTDGNSIHFTMDSDSDGSITLADEDICYYRDSVDGNIKRRTGGGGIQPIAENITGLTFEYEFADGDEGIPNDADGDDTNDLDDIRKLDITIQGITADPDPITRQQRTFSLYTFVVIRNAGVIK